ncbi:MAG: TetR/AcrR family transcriptional regulator [Actinomycetota bacterium]
MTTTRMINVAIATVKSVGYRHSRDDVVAAAASIALRDGMAKLTYRKVAEELGISDRMVVYYLPSKEELVLAAVGALSVRMQTILEQAFGDERRSPDELLKIAWPVLTKRSADRIFALFLEVVGLSAAKVEPYDRISKSILDGWIRWLSDRIDAPTERDRRRGALGVIARIDGLLLLRHGHGVGAADEAARALGLLSS